MLGVTTCAVGEIPGGRRDPGSRRPPAFRLGRGGRRALHPGGPATTGRSHWLSPRLRYRAGGAILDRTARRRSASAAEAGAPPSEDAPASTGRSPASAGLPLGSPRCT